MPARRRPRGIQAPALETPCSGLRQGLAVDNAPFLAPYRDAGEHEITYRLYGQDAYRVMANDQIGPGAVDVHKGLHSESRRKQIRDDLTESGHAVPRPGEPGKEQADRRDEQEQDKHRLPPCDDRTPELAEKYAGHYEHDCQPDEIAMLSDLRQAEKPEHDGHET